MIEISINGQKQFRTLMAGEGYLAQNSLVAHFGIDTATLVDYVKVTWLSGQVDRFNNLSPNHEYKIIEGNQTLNVVNTNLTNNVSFSPNPVTEKLFLISTNNITKIKIFDILGKEIDTYIFDANEVEVNTNQLISGVYFIKVYSKSSSEILKIIKL